MKLRDFLILADESVDPRVSQFLAETGFDVLQVRQAGWQGVSDIDILRGAFADDRVVLTQDADFGRFAIQELDQHHERVTGVVYLRPAHRDASFTIGTLQTVLQRDPELEPPFVMIARRRDGQVAVRVRKRS